MRDLIEKLQKIEEGFFSELDITLDEFKAKHPEATPVQIVAHVRRVHGNDAAKYVSDQFEREGDKADWLGEDEIGGFPGFSEQQSYDEFVDYYVQDLSSSIVRKGVFQDLYKAAGNDIDVLNAAIKDEAYSIADSYYGTGEGIGTSDMNHFIQGIGKQLGVDDLFGWYKKKESIEESDEEGINTPELFDREGYHLEVRKGKFMPNDMLDGRVVLHDLENISPGSGNPKIVTFDDLTLAKETAKKFGGMVIRTALKTYRIVPIMKDDEEMERDKAVRAMKANSAIRRQQGLEEDSGHSIFDILSKEDVYHLIDDLEYGNYSWQTPYGQKLDDYYEDQIPYDVMTGDVGDPSDWIKEKIMQDYGDEIDAIAAQMAREQIAAIRKNSGLSEENSDFYQRPYENEEEFLNQKVKIERTASGDHVGETGVVTDIDKYRGPHGDWEMKYTVKLDSGKTITLYPDEWSHDQLELVKDPMQDFMLDNPFESIDEEIDPAWGGAVEEWMEYRREGFRDARDGVYRPEAYVGKAKEAYKLGKEDWVSKMAQESIEEGVVKVPRGLRGEEGNPLGLTSQDAEDFVNSLGPDDVVSTDVVDPETGELLDWPDKGTRRELGKKQYKRDELERKEREEEEHEEGYDSPYLYVPNLHADPERAWEGIQTLKYDREFTEFYNIVWRSVREIAGVPGDFGTANDEEWADLDYDVDVDVPVAIKRKDGKKFNKQDRKNFDEISKIFKAAMGNIGLHYIGSSDNGTVARFTPTFM